jgi:hypothetical protein
MTQRFESIHGKIPRVPDALSINRGHRCQDDTTLQPVEFLIHGSRSGTSVTNLRRPVPRSRQRHQTSLTCSAANKVLEDGWNAVRKTLAAG